MPDVYAAIAHTPLEMQERLAKVLELRAADPQQGRMLDSYLGRIEFPPKARVLEVGCGTGSVARKLARRPGVAETIGIDLSELFLERARELSSGIARLSFLKGDARSLPFKDASFDAVVFHTTLCHLPEPETALEQAFRALKSGGWLAVFDGDYSTASVGVGDFDPLQASVQEAMAALVHDRWLIRRLAKLAACAGFLNPRLDTYGYVESSEPGYMLTIIERGADLLASSRSIGPEMAAAIKAEARRRAKTGEFFGQISYASLVARKPR